MIKPPLVTFCSILGLFTIGPVFTGGASAAVPSTVQGVAENEVVRRQDSVVRAREAISAGDRAVKGRDFDTAVLQYHAAVDLLPQAPGTHSLRQKALGRFCDASVQLAKARIAEGKYAEATAAVKLVLVPAYNPHYREAIDLLTHLEQPDYYNKTITPKFYANVEQVRLWLTDAKGFYDTGRYDLAAKRYEQVLNIDPYNLSARKGLEQVDLAKYNYGIAAYDQTRGHAMQEVERAWEQPYRKYGLGLEVTEPNPQMPNSATAIIAKLNRIVIPKVEFKDATIREAIDFLKKKSAELDDKEPDPAKRGVNIVLQLDAFGSGAAPAAAPASAPADATAAPAIPGLDASGAPAAAAPAAAPAAPPVNPNDARITLSVGNMPLYEVLRYVTQLANLKVKIDPWAVSIVPITVVTDQLLTKEYNVPPGFISTAPTEGGEVNMATATGGSTRGTGTPAAAGPPLGKRPQAKEFLEANGIQFPQGASANFIPSASKLIVHNTQDNLDLVDALVEASSAAVPKQVEIEAKFVEIQQTNLKELSFDWLLGQMSLGTVDGQPLKMGGGTAGNTPQICGLDYPFNIASGEGPVTAGLRSGGNAISSDAIDSLLYPSNGNSTKAPAVLGFSGVIDGANFQMVIRALNQKKGVDLLCAPRVTTKSGQRATVEIVREFRYPTEFNPPQVPQTIGGGNGNTSVTFIPVTPTTPTAFETRNTGVTLEVEPVVGPDGATIDLNLVPQVVEFEGFVNYGSPIMGPAVPVYDMGFINGYTTSILTPNIINQPIFSTRKVTTSVSIWDGQTVMLGGLVREDVQKVEDKVPFLGDIPWVGRAFRSSVDQHIKLNLVIFVSARLINPAGEPVNENSAQKEDVVDAVSLPGALPDASGLPATGGGLPTAATTLPVAR